ncbi:hypothetical protein JW905_08645 [bacterium]|nr:hypothetical protein [candidate division CSSED10-310 bacterium]
MGHEKRCLTAEPGWSRFAVIPVFFLLCGMAAGAGVDYKYVYLLKDGGDVFFRYIHPEDKIRLNPGVIILPDPRTAAAHDYDELAAYFQQLGYSVIIIDYEGLDHLSGRSGICQRLEEKLPVVLDQLATLRYFRRRQSVICAVGAASWYGLRLVAEDKRYGGLMLIDPVISWQHWIDEHGGTGGCAGDEKTCAFHTRHLDELEGRFKESVLTDLAPSLSTPILVMGMVYHRGWTENPKAEFVRLVRKNGLGGAGLVQVSNGKGMTKSVRRYLGARAVRKELGRFAQVVREQRVE